MEEHYLPKNRSVVLIDGEGPGMATCRCDAMIDNPEATFIAADAKPAWDWTTGGNNRFPKGGESVPFVANDFRLHKSELPWMSMPWSDLPYWQTSWKGSEKWIPRSPVQRAFRTAGLIRGKHPYVLIVDDIQKDASPHVYQWGMTLEDDLVQVPAVHDSENGSYRNDVVLGEKQKGEGKSRFMLVRPLNVEGSDPSAPRRWRHTACRIHRRGRSRCTGWSSPATQWRPISKPFSFRIAKETSNR